MDMGFAVVGPLARPKRPPIRFLSIGPRLSLHASFRPSLAAVALALRQHFTSIRLCRGLAPRGYRTCSAHLQAIAPLGLFDVPANRTCNESRLPSDSATYPSPVLALYPQSKRTILARMITVGSFEISSIVNGTIRLDGGAIFGVVPKVLWQKSSDVDELNRVLLATRTLLAVDRAGKRVVLVDTGCGTKWSPDESKRFAITCDPEAIPDGLSAAGLSVDDVTDIVITHLHFDHNGGLTDWFDDPDGPTTLRYPRARHWIHRGHWEHAMRPGPEDQASFLERDFAALGDAGVLEFVEKPQRVLGLGREHPERRQRHVRRIVDQVFQAVIGAREVFLLHQRVLE